MRLVVTRLDADGRYETMITRRDRVSYRVKGVAHNFAIPHDVAHFVVEDALRLARGFWGSVASGAVFRSMSHAAGRRKPRAAQRSEDILKANSRQLGDAEVLVLIFNETIEQGHGETSPVLQMRLKEHAARCGPRPREIVPSEIAKVYAAYRAVLQTWQELPVGGTLSLEWTV